MIGLSGQNRTRRGAGRDGQQCNWIVPNSRQFSKRAGCNHRLENWYQNCTQFSRFPPLIRLSFQDVFCIMNTVRGFQRIFLILIIAFLLTAAPGVGSAQSEDQKYFPETRLWVSGPFLAYWESAADPYLLFGYPITRQYIDPRTKQPTQYFQRARLDLVQTAEGQMVIQAPLGEYLHQANAPLADISTSSPACRSFETTGRHVCYAFLQFYETYDGARFLGDPISDTEIREGRYVQYFSKARLEWWPEKTAGQRVAVTDLGRIYFDQLVANPAYKQPDNDYIPSEPIRLSVMAFIGEATIASNSTQTLYVVVQDQRQQPVPDAVITVTVLLPDGSTVALSPQWTNADGILIHSFQVGNLPPREIVQVMVKAATMGEEAETQTWFRIWW